jgi:Ca-activated chloride channel family protein
MIPSNLTFGAPGRLLLLLGVAALGVAYVWVQRRRATYEERFADDALLSGVMPRRPGWRRHVGASVMILAMAAMTTGFAKPSADITVPRENATVVVALDTSGSMRATDVSPSRLEAAKAAAEQFVQGLPKGFAVGLVSFNTNASIVAAPTLDHASIMSAIDALELGGGTAIGDALSASVQAAKAMTTPTAAQSAAPVHVVLLSDGTNTAGRTVAEGVSDANGAGYPVSTIAYGTQDGVVVVGDRQVRVPVDSAALAGIAEDTGGTAYQALTGSQLNDVYHDIAQDVGTKTVHRDITARLVALSLLTAFGAAGVSLIGLRVFS